MSEWIPTSESMPQLGQACLVVWSGRVQEITYRRSGYGYACVDGYAWETAFDTGTDAIPDDEVTHWMPLPLPPEE